MSGLLLQPQGSVRHGPWSAGRQIVERPTAGWRDWFGTMLVVLGTRRHLAEMDARMLQDIGLSRADALVEASRAPWDCGPRAQ